jgi:hypothetical protein
MAEQPLHPQPAPGEAAAPPAWMAWTPALRAALFDPESWRESLETYADSTHLAVALVDGVGCLVGPCYNPRPTWSRLHAHQSAARLGPSAARLGPAALVSPTVPP